MGPRPNLRWSTSGHVTSAKVAPCYAETENPIRAEPTWRIAPTSSLPPETGFTLRAYRQHEDSVDFGNVAIQRHIPMRPATDHQFPLAVFGRATDQGVRFNLETAVAGVQNG